MMRRAQGRDHPGQQVAAVRTDWRFLPFRQNHDSEDETGAVDDVIWRVYITW